MVSDESNKREPLRYAMIGKDGSSTEDKLEKYVGTVDWKYLAPHYLTGSLFFVDPQLALVEVGQAFSYNEKDKVEEWLKNGDLVKIGDLHAEQWRMGGTEFEALVVSPCVRFGPI
ncbi:MAG: DUF2288 family protein [Akkermansiaceae bacterium]